MANPKYSDILRNPYTGEEIEITASKEDVFLRRRDEQIDKWEKEQYIRQQQQEAQRLTENLQAVTGYLRTLCYCNLHPLSPESYINESLSLIYHRRRYKPTLDDAEKDVGITTFVKAKAILPGKSKAKLEDLRLKAKELLASRLEEYNQKVKEDEEEYLQKRNKEERTLRNRIYALSKGSIVAARQYYAYALDHDDYSVDSSNRFQPEHTDIKFLPDTGEIRFAYRIPNGDEIPAVARYEYDLKTDSIVPRNYDIKTSAKWKLQIAESVLLRTAALVFLSDHYDKIKNVSITGYLRYYDTAFGNDQYKAVIQVNLLRTVFDKVSLETVNPIDLFSRVLKANIAAGLYVKEPYALSEIE